jgi:hypothetical protein
MELYKKKKNEKKIAQTYAKIDLLKELIELLGGND